MLKILPSWLAPKCTQDQAHIDLFLQLVAGAKGSTLSLMRDAAPFNCTDQVWWESL